MFADLGRALERPLDSIKSNEVDDDDDDDDDNLERVDKKRYFRFVNYEHWRNRGAHERRYASLALALLLMATFVHLEDAIKTSYAQSPKSSSGLGFGSSLITGHVVTPTHSGSSYRCGGGDYVGGYDNAEIIFSNNGPPESVTTSEAGSESTIITSNQSPVLAAGSSPVLAPALVPVPAQAPAPAPFQPPITAPTHLAPLAAAPNNDGVGTGALAAGAVAAGAGVAAASAQPPAPVTVAKVTAAVPAAVPVAAASASGSGQLPPGGYICIPVHPTI